MNKIILSGRLTKDIELRYTPGNVAVASGSIAVTRDFKNKNGEYESDFFNILAYGKLAEIVSNQSRKGILCELWGRLQSRSYDNQQGQRVYVTEVVVEGYKRLETLEVREISQEQTTSFHHAQSPFEGATMDVPEDDLPF